MSKTDYPLFSVFGIELEYMIVDKNDLSVKPIADQLILELSGTVENEIELGAIALSNELAMHVVELKTNGPAKSLENLSENFHEVILTVNEALKKFDAVLMPTGAHPWLDPKKGIKLWHHGDRTIYETFHRIFNCSGHGWGNLQSTHLNLPFANEEEFVALHSAIRLLLAFIPALTASTPILEGQYEGALDSRLLFYGTNQASIPHISGHIIPEPVQSIAEYHAVILQPMYRDIAQYDPENIMQNEWLNSRGAVAKFKYGAIEIRILDLQESPQMDLACIALIVEVLKDLMKCVDLKSSLTYPTTGLKVVYDEVIYKGFDAQVTDQELLTLLKCDLQAPCTVKEVWQALITRVSDRLKQPEKEMLHLILEHGNLAQRISQAVGTTVRQEVLFNVYQSLMDCLKRNVMFLP
jgi:gamma-glutamyl:cysteine ligase YbdK (ATP-grasp superfamily)